MFILKLWMYMSMSCKHIFSSFTSHPRFTKPRLKKQTPSSILRSLKSGVWTSGKNIENKSAKSFTWKNNGTSLDPGMGGTLACTLEVWFDLKSSHAEGQSQGQVTRFFYRFFFPVGFVGGKLWFPGNGWFINMMYSGKKVRIMYVHTVLYNIYQ